MKVVFLILGFLSIAGTFWICGLVFWDCIREIHACNKEVKACREYDRENQHK